MYSFSIIMELKNVCFKKVTSTVTTIEETHSLLPWLRQEG